MSCPASSAVRVGSRSDPTWDRRIARSEGGPLVAIRHLRHLITYGNSPRKRARLMARASSRCFLADTAVIRLGTILPRSETERLNSLESFSSVFGAFRPGNGHALLRREDAR